MLAAALAHAPENAAYGLMAFAPLGAAFGPVAMSLALLGAAVANLVATVCGAGRLVGGPRASLALLTAGLVAALVPLWPATDLAGAWRVAAIVGLGVVAAGALQLLFGALRFGGIVKYTPYPVRLGLGSGIGLLLAITAWPVMAGLGFGASRAWSPSAWHGGALVVGGTAAAAMVAGLWRHSRVPPLLLGLVAGTLAHALLGAVQGSTWLGGAVGTPLFPPGWVAGLQGALATAAPQPWPWRATIDLLAPYALTVAVLCSLDTLLATSLVDGRLRRWRDPNRELVAQGVSAMAAALVGAQPTSPSVPRSASIGGRAAPARQAVLVYGLLMLALAGLAPWALSALPVSALGGVLVVQGLAMVAPTVLRTPADLLLSRWRPGSAAPSAGTPVRLLWANWAVSVAVALNAVLLGVGPAVLIGAALSVLLFVRGNIRDVVRSAWHADTRHSLKVRPAHVVHALQQHGSRIAVLELHGALFFGTGDGLRTRLSALATTVDCVVLDLRQVPEVDVTGARILFELALDWSAQGKRLLLAEWPAGDARRQTLEAVAGLDGTARLDFEDHADRALEHAEDALLQRLGVAAEPGVELALQACALARGLDAAELQRLRAACTVVRFPRGSLLFRQGDPGDALYLVLQGDIGLHVPGGSRRLASFAAGTSLGEIGVLSQGVRSVDAVAETDATALRLPADTFHRWRDEQPHMAAKLLNNMALYLANRLQWLTNDLAHWMARAGAAPATPAQPAGPVEAVALPVDKRWTEGH